MSYYPLSRYVRDEVTLEEFVEGFHKFIAFAMQSLSDHTIAANNLSELDKAIPGMLESKVLSTGHPRHGLMFKDPKMAALILRNPYLLQLLFRQRISPKKHEWPTHMLSPISRHLLSQSNWDQLPVIYKRFGRELDASRSTVSLSTPDFLIMSVLSYPLQIGPQIPQILGDINASYRHWKGDGVGATNHHHAPSSFMTSLSGLWGDGRSRASTEPLPLNPFKAQINGEYGRVFRCYLDEFVPRRPGPDGGVVPNDYGLRFLEMVGELWFGGNFREKPIGDRCFTLPLLQDVVYRVMEKQVDFQRWFYEQRRFETNDRRPHRVGAQGVGAQGVGGGGSNEAISGLFGSGGVPTESCLCPELLVLRRSLFWFFRESLDHFPLDVIAKLRLVLEMWLYVMAPWTIEIKQRAPDRAIAARREEELRQFNARRRAEADSSSIGGMVLKWLSLSGSSAADHAFDGGKAAQMMADREFANRFHAAIGGVNDDRQRTMHSNNTQFATADEMVRYEMDAVMAVDDRNSDLAPCWRQYIAEMLPFYSSLLGRFQTAMLKYDLGHPLKQLPVLKILSVFKLHTVRATVAAAEMTLFQPQPSWNGDCYGTQSAQQFVLRVIAKTTFQPIQNYERCPLDHDPLPKAAPNASPSDPTPSELLYLKCKKSMLRLLPNESAAAAAAAIDELDEFEEDGHGQNGRSQHRDGQRRRGDKSTESEMERTGYRVLEGMVAAVQTVMAWLCSMRSMLRGDGDGVMGSDGKGSTAATPYFVDRADSILMLRHIVGTLEELFGIEPSKREELMNQTIMWEPSQSTSRSISPSLTLPGHGLRRDGAKGSAFETERERVERRGRSVWERPQGEWEWFWALKFHRFLYGLVLRHCSDRSRRFYLKYISCSHRSFGADVRALGWYLLLFVAYRLFWSWLFTLCALCFVAQIARSLLVH